MSRKIRNTTVVKESANDKFSVAGYVRLSVVKENYLGDSVQNQANIIKEYIDSHDNMKLFKIYIDENVSGNNFDRNGFNEMLKDIEALKINCVIVKDLSRFGRDLISVGYYVQRVFPSKKIRFISIDDNFDTLDGITNIDDPTRPVTKIPITALVDEYYTKDISQKVQSTIDHNIKSGKFIAPRAPFGYMKSKSDCHKLVIDEDAAFIVREIFNHAYNCSSLTKIVRLLNQQQYLTPINYAISKGLKGNYDSGNGLWNTRTVKNILTNKVYVGDLEQGKDKYLVKNTHEAIISREIFDNVNNALNHNTETIVKENLSSLASDNIFRGKVICGDCGGKMQRRKRKDKSGEYYYFSCIINNRIGPNKCGGMYIKESDINDAADNAVKKFISQNKNTYQALVYSRKDVIEKLKDAKNQFDIANDIKGNYEAYIAGAISENEYQSIKNNKDTFKNEISNLESELVNLEFKINVHESITSSLYKNMVNLYIDKIVIFSSKKIKVCFAENIS